MALHSCPSAVLYYRAVITREVITGIYDTCGDQRRVGWWSTREWIFVAERQGRLRPLRREVGLALFGVRGYLIKHTQTSSTDNPVIAFPQGDEGRIAG